MSIPQPFSSTYPKLYLWTKNLNSRIWDEHTDYRNQVLEDSEWTRIHKIIKSGKVILTVRDVFGFVLRVGLWSYPQLKDDKPELLIVVGNDNLKDMKSGLNSPSGGFWELLFLYTHSEENKRVVELFLPQEELKSKNQYSYI